MVRVQAESCESVSGLDVEAEIRRCADGYDGFIYWCRTYVRIVDKRSRRLIPFELFALQSSVARDLFDGLWLWILKARQLGLTWLIAAYCLWMATFRPGFQALVLNQSLPYAVDFLDRVKLMYSQLPSFLRSKLAKSNDRMIRFGTGDMSEIRALAGSKKSARSMTADLLVADEAAYIEYLDMALAAATPALEIAGGQIVGLSTSDGPTGAFYETFEAARVNPDDRGVGANGFKPIFFSWRERPGRDEAWYARESARFAHLGPHHVKHEYPDTPDEAWEYAEGKVYAQFENDRHVGRIEIPDSADRYRAIDWGASNSPHVCLWLAHIPGPPGFLIHPDCRELIREMHAYRWEEGTGRARKEDDHGPDALRYACVTFDLTGTVYVYRERYVYGGAGLGMTDLHDIRAIHEMTGWELGPDQYTWQPSRGGSAERIQATVADRSQPKSIALYCQHGIPCVGNRAPRKPRGTDAIGNPRQYEIVAGIKHVAMLIDARMEIRRLPEPNPFWKMVDQSNREAGYAVPVTYPLEERMQRRFAEWVEARRRKDLAALRQRMMGGRFLSRT